MSNYCVDTAFLIALYSRRDQQEYRQKALEYFQRFDNRANKMVMPWPVMYEAINTRIAGYAPGIELLARHLRSFQQTGQLTKVDDSPYRERALDQCLSAPREQNDHRALSLVDRVLRLLLADTSFRFTGLITFDEGHFRDVCRQRNIQLYGRA